MNRLSLILNQRFWPLFTVQFFGAFNDNVFKQALIVLLVFKVSQAGGSESSAGFYSNMAAGLFMLPFLICSPIAGQLSDKFNKSTYIQILKGIEILLMILAGIALYLETPAFLLTILFLMGSQSAFFGPVKYSMLPQLLKSNELMTGNSLIEMSTFIAILLGLMFGGYFIESHKMVVITALVVFSIAGFAASLRLPSILPGQADLKLDYNIARQASTIIKIAHERTSVYHSILGISWLWFIGATVLAQLPNYAKFYLGGGGDATTLLISLFVLGVATGSLLAIKISKGIIELGLVPFGAIGMTVFMADLFFIDYSTLTPYQGFFNYFFSSFEWNHYRIVFDLTMTGVFSSFFVVPLYALVQARSQERTRSRVIAANNIINSLFMVASAIIAIVLYSVGFSTIDIFMSVAIVNLILSLYIFTIIPEFVIRFFIFILAKFIYRVRFINTSVVPQQGSAIIICNHVSYIDWLFITAACQRPSRFVMDHSFYKWPLINKLFRFTKVTPIASQKEDPELKEAAFQKVQQDLKNGHIVTIFPEGTLTKDGQLLPFRAGIERIIEENPNVPVIPMALIGLWGSFFSHERRDAIKKMPKPSRRIIHVIMGEPIRGSKSAEELRDSVGALIRKVSEEATEFC